MDKNKRAKLESCGYVIRKCCFNCAHGRLSPSLWGTCAVHTYEHQKHTGEARQMSIHASGYCPHHTWKQTTQGAFDAFREN